MIKFLSNLYGYMHNVPYYHMIHIVFVLLILYSYHSFIRTSQASFLSAQTSDLPNILKGIQSVCAIESTLLGNVSVANGDVSSSSLAAEPTGISAAKRSNLCETGIMTYLGMMTLGLIALTIFWVTDGATDVEFQAWRQGDNAGGTMMTRRL